MFYCMKIMFFMYSFNSLLVILQLSQWYFFTFKKVEKYFY